MTHERHWHHLNERDVVQALGISDTQGLSSGDARKQLSVHGRNKLDEQSVTHWSVMLLRQFKSSLIFILVIASVLSFFIGDELDALAIVAVIFLNALLGFVQEWKAESALQDLKKMLSSDCLVVRDGEQMRIDREELVPGDRVLLTTGNAVPADIRLLHEVDLEIDEAALTGESAPIAKEPEWLKEDTPIAERLNMAFMGTYVVNGHGDGVVVATGMQTEFGKIADLTGGIEQTQTRLQKHLGHLAGQLGILAIAVSLAVIVIGFLGGKDLLEMAMTGVALAVSAVPEGLPAVVTITLALGMGAMARKKAILRKLQAAETLGAVSVICTDKTGTLTKNEMMVQSVWLPSGEVFDITGAGYEPEGVFEKQGIEIDPHQSDDLMTLLRTGIVCNVAHIEHHENEWRAMGTPTEAALLVAGMKAGLSEDTRADADIIKEFSFNSSRKRMSVVELAQGYKDRGHQIIHVKGAPEAVLERCVSMRVNGKFVDLTAERKAEIEAAYTGFAKGGLRTLALAQKQVGLKRDVDEETAEGGLVFLGVVGVIDPPRTEVKEALQKAQAAGVRVIVITGDSPDTAAAIASQIGLDVDRTVTSLEMKDMEDRALSDAMLGNVLFARTVPEDKYRIVKLLQEQDQLVAMTGDGVNDAPALKQADIGISMGIRGTDVAKGAADIVLTDDNFVSIVAAIEEGRRQYANIRKFVRYLTSANIGEILAILINIVVGGPLILLPIQILWVNLVTDSATAVSLSVEKPERNIMSEPPRPIDEPILDKKSFLLLGIFGSYIGLATFGLYQIYLPQSYELANSMAFTAMVLMSNIHALNFRNLHGPIAHIGWSSNRWILIAIPSMIFLQFLALYTPFLQRVLHVIPLSAGQWGVLFLTALPLFILPEIYKAMRYRR